MTTLQQVPDSPETTTPDVARLDSITATTMLACLTSHDEGYEEGHKDGYVKGHNEGWHSGYEDGIAAAAELQQA